MAENTIQKPKRAPGPFRTGLVVPVLIVFTVVGLYLHFFLDHHIRRGVEIFGSYIHGAEVNLSHFKSSFFGAYAEAGGLQVTDKGNPDKNLVEIGEMRFEMLWDALLRAKIVVNDASVREIKLQSPRAHRGWVRPPEPPGQESNALNKLQNTVLTQVEEQNEENLLGSLSQLAQGVSGKDVLKSIENQLQAEKRIKELQVALKEKEKLWKERIENLPKKEEFKAIESKAKLLKFDTKNPKEFADDLKELKSLVKQADTKVDQFKSSGKELNTDVGQFSKDIGSIDEWIQKDIDDIEKRLKIPKLDAAAFSKSLFMRMFSDKLTAVHKYSQLAKQYVPMPHKKKGEEEVVIPPPRGEGKVYTFPKTKGYPLFWLKKSEISSRSTPGGLSGDLDGTITNVTDNQTLVGEPLVAQIKGAFPQQNIRGILGQLKIDHRTEPGQNLLDLVVGSYLLNDLELSDSKDVQLSLAKADTSSEFNASMVGENINVSLKNQFRSPEYKVSAKSSSTEKILNAVLNAIPLITLDASAAGTWAKFKLDIDSNLGRAISDSFQAYMKAEIDRIKTQIRAEVDQRIGAERAKLEAEHAKLKSQIDTLLKGKEKEIETAKSEIKNATQGSENQKAKAKDDLKKKGKELFKKLKL